MVIEPRSLARKSQRPPSAGTERRASTALRSVGLRPLARRWIAFGSVGALGFGVQFTTLVLLTGWLEANYLLATAIAVELAILHNFFWHQHWTWSDRAAGGAARLADRLLRFNAGTAVTSIGGNLVLMSVLVSRFEIHYAIANVLAVLSLSIANFLLCDRLVFKPGLLNGWRSERV